MYTSVSYILGERHALHVYIDVAIPILPLPTGRPSSTSLFASVLQKALKTTTRYYDHVLNCMQCAQGSDTSEHDQANREARHAGV